MQYILTFSCEFDYILILEINYCNCWLTLVFFFRFNSIINFIHNLFTLFFLLWWFRLVAFFVWLVNCLSFYFRRIGSRRVSRWSMSSRRYWMCGTWSSRDGSHSIAASAAWWRWQRQHWSFRIRWCEHFFSASERNFFSSSLISSFYSFHSKKCLQLILTLESI